MFNEKLMPEVIQTAMDIVVEEAQMGDLHNHINNAISQKYDIPIQNLNKVKPGVDLDRHVKNIFDAHDDKIESHQDLKQFVKEVHKEYHSV